MPEEINGYAGYEPSSKRIPVTSKPGSGSQHRKFNNVGRGTTEYRVSKDKSVSSLMSTHLRRDHYGKQGLE